MQKMQELIDDVNRETNFAANPYFTALESGEFSREDFLETQIQFCMAVIFFSRPMAVMAAKIPQTKKRLEIIRNVWEEHGEGDNRGTHSETFIMFLQRMGISEDEIWARLLWPETRRFNTTLMGCALDEILVSAAVFGMIEGAFSDISASIGNCIINRGWLSQDEIVHYKVHKELDIKHAQDFFDVLEKPWQENAENRYIIEQGIRLGAFTFNSFYEDLYNARQTRRNRSVRCLHSRA